MPDDLVQPRRHDLVHQPRRAPPLRRRAGDRAERPWRRGAAGRGLDASALRARRSSDGVDVRPRRRRLEVRLRHLRLRAAGAAKASRTASSGTVELHFTFDEEIGGLIGPKWLLDEGIVKPDYCISAGLSYSIVTAHNGCLHLEVTVHGKSAHAAAPETGIDALAGDERRPRRRSMRERRRLSGARLEASRHRPSEPDGRADLGRHQHQCRPRQGHDPPRPAHDARRRIRRQVEAHLRGVIARSAARDARHRGARSSASSSPRRCASFRARTC